MCLCIAGSSTRIDAKNCLLQNPHPSITSDWNIGSVSSAMILWFVASLATSVGTLPFINSYMQFENEGPTKAMVVTWNKFIVISYILITVAAIISPVIMTAVQFPGSVKHMDSLMNMLMYSSYALVFLVVYNYQTVARYIGYATVANGKAIDINLQNMSINNWILYVHLLVSAPAIAMVLHLTQQWTEYHMIVNTTLVLSTIFAVDAFSAEMANYWAHHTTKRDATSKKTFDGMNSIPGLTEDEKKKQMAEVHTRLGLIRLFAWVVNAVMLLLLFTLAYPIEIEQQKTNSAIFVVIVVAFAAVFLAPDLVREFTDQVSFSSLNFRLYGDFIVRAMAVFFVWRASVSELT
jgi:hypothetical protein